MVSKRRHRETWPRAATLVALGAGLLALQLQTLFQNEEFARHLVSRGLWRAIVSRLGGRVLPLANTFVADISWWSFAAITLTVAFVTWLAGGWYISRRRGLPLPAALGLWGVRGWLWWLIPGVWEMLRILAFSLAIKPLEAFLASTPELWLAVVGAGWCATLAGLASRPVDAEIDLKPLADDFHVPRAIWFGVLLYAVAFGVMNWQLYAGLLVPHGDSAMYEEHLWNLLHGKGFRSYLDGGRLFLGEHIQVIHLLLTPLYLVWPSHLLLELCQTAGLAAGAIPVFWLARRHTGSPRAATALACAYLLYPPMQFLDIAVDLKTFRPSAFEIPFLLAAFDMLERKRMKPMLAWLTLAVLCQEDAAVIIAPLGVWLACRHWGAARRDAAERAWKRLGVFLAGGGAGYVLLVVLVVLPWFRGGETVHYLRYFSGATREGQAVPGGPTALIGLAAQFLSLETLIFVLALLLPLGCVPGLSPGRLAVAAPLAGILCLSAITNDPRHHFHAPLVPVVVWAAAAGLARAPLWRARWQRWWVSAEPVRAAPHIAPGQFRDTARRLPLVEIAGSGGLARPGRHDEATIWCAAVWCVASAAWLGFFWGLSPLSLGFWDAGSTIYWKALYVPGPRARLFGEVLKVVPRDSRVASTDFVHPRFTHHARSYDYSDYRPHVPEDADFIVIDTRHPYSRIHVPNEVKEYHDHPDQWELLPDHTDGYFIVLRRRRG